MSSDTPEIDDEAPDLAYDTWFNGDPRLQIQHGTYVRNRKHLKGCTEDQLATWDALNDEVNGDDERSLVERKREERAKVKEAISNKKEKKNKKDSK